MNSLFSLVIVFAITVNIECGLSLIFKSGKLVYCVFLCNLLTNPLLNVILLLYYNLVGQNYYWFGVTVLELAVVLVETFIIKVMMNYSTKKALLLSFFFNVSSFAAGLVMIV